jgi:hypothetical protein
VEVAACRITKGQPESIIEAIRQWTIELDAEVERLKTDPRAKIDTAAITAIEQRIKDLDAAVQRIREARRDTDAG